MRLTNLAKTITNTVTTDTASRHIARGLSLLLVALSTALFSLNSVAIPDDEIDPCELNPGSCDGEGPPYKPAIVEVTRTGNSSVIYGTNGITVKWRDTSFNEKGFKLYRKLGGQIDGTVIQSYGAQSGITTTFTDAGRAYDTTYCYKISANNDFGSIESPWYCAKTSPTGINPPHVRSQIEYASVTTTIADPKNANNAAVQYAGSIGQLMLLCLTLLLGRRFKN